jgi:hypothetical protein
LAHPRPGATWLRISASPTETEESQAPTLPTLRQWRVNLREVRRANGVDSTAMSLKKTLIQQGMKMFSDPRVQKVIQDERVMKAMMQMMQVPGKVQTFSAEQVEKLARAMSLATEDEVNDLKRTVRRLEEEIARIERDSDKKRTIR